MKVKLDVVLKKRPAAPALIVPPEAAAAAAAAAAATKETVATSQGAVPKSIKQIISEDLNSAWTTPPSPAFSHHRIAPEPPATLPKPKPPAYNSFARCQSMWNISNPAFQPIIRKTTQTRKTAASRRSLRPKSQLDDILEPLHAENERERAICNSRASLV